jgi:hypothetical protein
MVKRLRVAATAFGLLMPVAFGAKAAELPDAIAAKDAVLVLQVHAEGAQIYECKADASGKTTWHFREPIASLMRDGKTVGRHFAGPSWEIDGSTIVGTAGGRAPGATAKDIPWLKLSVSDRHGDGPLGNVTMVQRINTKGGNVEGGCEKAGDFRTEPYSADYVFLRQGP